MRVLPNVTSLVASKAHCWNAETRWFDGLELEPPVKPHTGEPHTGEKVAGKGGTSANSARRR